MTEKEVCTTIARAVKEQATTVDLSGNQRTSVPPDLAHQIKLTEELAKRLGEQDYWAADLLEKTGGGARAEWSEGAELRVLRKLLDEVDPKQHWGGLKKVLTPEGHWLCEKHAQEYKWQFWKRRVDE